MKKILCFMVLLIAVSSFLFASAIPETVDDNKETTNSNITTNNTKVITVVDSVKKPAEKASYVQFGDLIISEDFTPTTTKEKFYYGMGNDIINSYASYYKDLDFASFIKGVIDYYLGIKLTYEEIDEIVRNYNTEVAEKNLKEAEDFLANNLNNEGVMVTDSGLQYKIISEGNGVRASENANVTFNYELKLLNGEVQDSSYERGTPLSISLGNLIPGMREGLMLADEGSHYSFWIHPDLGYGSSQSGVPANSLLIFDVEVISIEEPSLEDSAETAEDVNSENDSEVLDVEIQDGQI